ncbi:MAG: hypothetical protein NW201_01560 [Gemmatimonadales bacterium]|nr:hypothetical protein [Gemmatimonadales bacterium]
MRAPVLAAACAVAAACAGAAPADRVPPPPGGTVTARWTGADSGRVVAAGEMRWCGALRRADLFASAGDTAIGVALFLVDSLRADSFGVVKPDSLPGDTTRPSARAALRVAKPNVVDQYKGFDGLLVLEEAGPREARGRLQAALGAATQGGPVRLEATFRVPLRRLDADSCPPSASRPPL